MPRSPRVKKYYRNGAFGERKLSKPTSEDWQEIGRVRVAFFLSGESSLISFPSHP